MGSRSLALVSESTPLQTDTLPEWPLGWYVVARSKDLRRGQTLAVTLGGEPRVLFRTQSGALAALDAHCPHMGAHLVHGTVRGEYLVCALHRFQLGVDGTVEGAGKACKHTRAARVAERFGLIFLHLGGEPASAIPAPDAADSYVWTTGSPVSIASDWHSMAVNGFDMPHLRAVHHRELVEPAQIITHGRERLTLTYTSRVIGKSLSDLLMKWLARNRIRVRQNCYGPIVIVETDLGFTQSTAVLGLLPHAEGVRAFGAFGIKPGLFSAPRLLLTRWLFTAFLRRDFGVVEGMRLRTDVEDHGVRALAAFLRSLPRHEP